jgi:hypothetical protein
MTQPVRIGNAQAFWGDRGDAAAEMLAREPELDYLTMDYLAEVSMSILALQRERDPEAGFARDFVDVVRSLVPYWLSGGRCRLIVNAGGLNPQGCANACRNVLKEAGCRSLNIGVVSGDDVLEAVRATAKKSTGKESSGKESSGKESTGEFRNLDTGVAISNVSGRLVTANAYVGAAPIVEALTAAADIVITGRIADPSLVVAACRQHFGWNGDDFSELAGATVAGHLIECGTQVTGGISTDWLDVPDPAHLGFPIVEVSSDGTCVVTKPGDSGGRVTGMTVKEQLVYEIGDPANYLSPDATVSFLSLDVDDLGDNRVRVSGAIGSPPPTTLKVSATYRDGFRAAGTLTIVGRQAVEKARRCGELILQRVHEAGIELRDSAVECVGSPLGDETVLRVAVEAETREAAERFTRELMPFITAGPQGTTGYAEGRPRVHPVIRYWPCLISRDEVIPRVEVISSRENGNKSGALGSSATRSPSDNPAGKSRIRPRPIAHRECPPGETAALYDIACARSGDKGISANVAIIARNAMAWKFLRTWLTADRVSEFFSHLDVESVERFELPNLGAVNFVLRGVLHRSLRTDAQGKALGQMLLEMPLPDDALYLISVNERSQRSDS